VSPARTLVLGLGNILLQDEALGVRAMEGLRQQSRLPEHVSMLDGGTLGLNLLPYLFECDQVLFLDAVNFDAKPGALIRLEGEEIPTRLAQKMSMHQIGLQDLLAALSFRGKLPGRMVLWGMQPESLDWGLELSPTVQTAMPALVAQAAQELSNWGVLAGTD
jgi:hydrogenase maturation protease